MANGLTYTRITSTSEATKQLASTLAPYLHAGDVVVLDGDLGAGKTQFVQGVAAALGVRTPVTSPTFNILLEYGEGRLPVYHYDLYRLGRSPCSWRTSITISAIDGDGDGVAFVRVGREVSRATCPTTTSSSTITADSATVPVVLSRILTDRARASCFSCGPTTRNPALGTQPAVAGASVFCCPLRGRVAACFRSWVCLFACAASGPSARARACRSGDRVQDFAIERTSEAGLLAVSRLSRSQNPRILSCSG